MVQDAEIFIEGVGAGSRIEFFERWMGVVRGILKCAFAAGCSRWLSDELDCTRGMIWRWGGGEWGKGKETFERQMQGLEFGIRE